MKKHLKKQLTLLLMLAAMLILPAVSALAAGVPGNVKNLKQKTVSETSVKLTWSKVKGASGYQIYRVDSNGATTKIASTKGTSHTLKKIVPNTAYTYQVRAFIKSKGTTAESIQPATIRVQTSVKKPAAPSGLRATNVNANTLQLKWNKAKNASGYYVFRYDEKEGKYVQLTTTKGTSFSAANLEEEVTVKFRVQSFRTVSGQTVTGETAEVSGTPKSLSGLAKQVHGRYFNATLRRNSVGTVAETGQKKTLKKGAKVTATARSFTSSVTVIMKDGTRVKVKGSDLRYNSVNAVTKEYPTNVKEAFVNEKGYSSKTNYLIWISQYTLSVNIFKGEQGAWKLIKRMPCIVGKDGRTTMGTFRLCRKDYAYGGVRIYFTWNNQKQWGNSFHRRVDGNTRGAYSHGCVRLADADLNYINRTCPMGTTVVSY